MRTGIETLCRFTVLTWEREATPAKGVGFWYPASGYHHKEAQNVAPVRSPFG